VGPDDAGAVSGFGVVPGLLLAVGVGLVATLGALAVPLVGAPVLAIVIGASLRSTVVRALPRRFDAGLRFASHTLLQAAIVVSGFALSFAAVVRTGLGTLPVMLGTVVIALVLAPIVGRIVRLDVSMQRLIGIGTAICGASAIAAVSTVLEPPEDDVAVAIATVFFFNIVAVIAFPPLGHLMHLSQAAFGVWAGTAINDTSSVVAAGFTYGREAGEHATIVKLTRATLIIPIVAILAVWRARQRRNDGVAVPWRRIVPWFIVWFVLAAVVNSAGIIAAGWHPAIGVVATFLISVALAGIGLGTNVVRLVRLGLVTPLVLGAVLWIAVALSSLALQRATGT
jgi:uncharacterized integral membrane protein (TIGR00698 family)